MAAIPAIKSSLMANPVYCNARMADAKYRLTQRRPHSVYNKHATCRATTNGHAARRHRAHWPLPAWHEAIRWLSAHYVLPCKRPSFGL